MTRLIGPASPFICTEVDVAFDANLNDPSESWDWTTLGDYQDGAHTRPRLLNQTIDIAHGRRDESNLADPTTVEVLLGNGDLALTPRNAASPYYPGLKRGTPLRVIVQAGLPHLVLRGVDGSRARTPHNAAFNVTDLSFALELLSPVQMPPYGTSYIVSGKYVATGDQRSWALFLNADGLPVFAWSSDGTNGAILLKNLPIGLACPEAGPLTLGGWFDVNNGASGNTFSWYSTRGTVDDLRSDLAGSLLATDTDSGTTSIFNSTAPVDLGDVEGFTSSSFEPYPGRVNRFQLRNGDLATGTVVADLRLTQLTAGDIGATDSAGRLWSFSDAAVSDRRPRFCGRVDKVTAEWGEVDESNALMPTIALVNVSASGILERLANGGSIGSAIYRKLTAPGFTTSTTDIYDYYPLEDGRGATQAFAAIGGGSAGTVAMDLASDDTLDASQALPSVSSGQSFGWNLVLSGASPASTWECTLLVKVPVAPDAGAGEFLDLMRIDVTGGVTSQWVLRIDDDDVHVFAKDLSGTNVLSDTVTADPSMFGSWMVVVLQVGLSGANITWGLSLFPLSITTGFGGSGTLASFGLPAGSPVRLRNLVAEAPQDGASFGHFAITSGAANSWLAPADTAYVGEPAAQRVFRLCQEHRIPIAVDGPYGLAWDSVIAAGGMPMGPQRPAKLLDLLEECAVVDFGFLGEQRGALGLTYRSGSTLLNQPTRLSLSRADRRVIEPFSEVDDDQRFANDVTVSRPDGSSYRIEDPDIAAGVEERYEQSTEVNVERDEDLPTQAGWRYHLGIWSEPRFPDVWTDAAKDASVVEDLLSTGVGDRFEVPDPPPGCPPVDQLVDGLTEELERFQWRVGFVGHPARAWDVGVLDETTPTTSASRLDTHGETTTFAASLSTTQTGARSVNVTGLLWPTAASYFPMDVEVDGEVVTLSGISGASSPQTFTIAARSVNGVAKTHDAGAVIRPATPLRLAPSLRYS
jgi:hypothetical protein